MADTVTSEDELAVNVVWNANDAAIYARTLQIAQSALIGSGGQRWTTASRLAAALVPGIIVFVLTLSPFWATLAALAGVVAAVGGQWAYYFDGRGNRAVERLFAADPDTYPARKITLGTSELKEVSDSVFWCVALAKIKRISRSDGLIFVWTSRADALAIPERCFASTEVADRFFSALQARTAAASQTTG